MMSGGHFDYQEYHISEIADSIREIILNQENPEWIKEQKETCPWFHQLSKEVLREYKKAYRCMTIAKIYATRIDYLESGDDGEDSFLDRLKDELGEAKKHFKTCFRQRKGKRDD